MQQPQTSASNTDFLKGNITGLKAFVEEYYVSLCRHLWERCKDWELAEAAAQESFIQLWKKRTQIPEEKLTEQLYFIAEKYLARHTKSRSTAEVSEEQTTAIIAALPGACKRIFMLNRQAGKSYQEIADELEISTEEVAEQMGQALQLFQQLSNFK